MDKEQILLWVDNPDYKALPNVPRMEGKPKKRDSYDYMYLLCEDRNDVMNEIKALDDRYDLGLKDDTPYRIDLEARRKDLEARRKEYELSQRPDAAVIDIKTNG
jgi:hypothetical protein